MVALQPPLRLALAGGGVALSAHAIVSVLELLDQGPLGGCRSKKRLVLARPFDDLDAGLARSCPDDTAAQLGRGELTERGQQRGDQIVSANSGLQAGGDAQAALAQIQRAAEPGSTVLWVHLDEELAGQPSVLPPRPARVRRPARCGTRRGQVEPDAIPPPLPDATMQQ